MVIQLLQEKFLHTCGQIKQKANQYILTPLEKRVSEAMLEVKKASSWANLKQVDKRITHAITKGVAVVLSASTKGIDVIRAKLVALHEKAEQFHFDAYCDLQISRSTAKIDKIDKQLNTAKKLVKSQYTQVELALQEFRSESLNQTVSDSLKRYLADPSAENLFQIGDAIRRQVDHQPQENRGFSASNKFHTGLKAKGLDLHKVAVLNALLREKKACVQERDAWISKKAARNQWLLTV